MKFFKLMMIAFLAILGLNSCSNDSTPPLDFIEVDYSKDLVGTWTYVEGEQAEVIEIKEDGSFSITGVMIHGALYEEKGTIKVVNNKVSLVFEGDDEVFEGRLEFVTGKSMSIVFNKEYDVRLTYDYCKTDLSDEIVGMWVLNNGQEMRIHTFEKNGNAVFTGWSDALDEFSVLENSKYKVVGDLIFQGFSTDEGATYKYIASKLIYTPDGTAHGDIMSFKHLLFDGTETVQSWLRVKEYINLPEKIYDYSSAYVSNAKGKDEDFTILNGTFNIDNINAGDFDVILGAGLYCVELNANSIKHKSRPYGEDVEVVTPITVDGNKVTLDFSTLYPALRKVDMYMYQNVNDSQLHMYMHTNAFINYFANLEVMSLLKYGEIDPTDAAAVEKVFTNMESRVESINVSFVLKARK